MKALVVDDSRAIRRIIGKSLKECGFTEVIEAEDGVKALAALADDEEGDPPDVMLLDWNMPNMNGYELLCAVRENERYEDVPIMMVTTEAEMSQMAKALEAGASEYLMKPFTKDMLVDKLEMLAVL